MISESKFDLLDEKCALVTIIRHQLEVDSFNGGNSVGLPSVYRGEKIKIELDERLYFPLHSFSAK